MLKKPSKKISDAIDVLVDHVVLKSAMPRLKYRIRVYFYPHNVIINFMPVKNVQQINKVR